MRPLTEQVWRAGWASLAIYAPSSRAAWPKGAEELSQGGRGGRALPERLAQRALAQLALRHQLPSVFGTKDSAVAGGLMSYAPDALDLNRRAAVYVDGVLGALSEDPVYRASTDPELTG